MQGGVGGGQLRVASQGGGTDVRAPSSRVAAHARDSLKAGGYPKAISGRGGAGGGTTPISAPAAEGGTRVQRPARVRRLQSGGA